MESSKQPSAGPEPSGDEFEVHRQMVVALFVSTMSLGLLLSIGVLLSHVTILMVVAGAGALGGFISVLRRVYSFQRVFPTDFFRRWKKINLHLLLYSMIPSLVGAIAAVTLYLIFASKLLEGDVFPSFTLYTVLPRADSFENFVFNWGPASPTDYAKAIVWGFVAGFSERFVPGILTRLTSEQSDNPGAKQQAAA